jgi:hypothetical protein
VLRIKEYGNRARSLSAGRSRGDLGADEEFSLALQRLIEILGEAGKTEDLPTLMTALEAFLKTEPPP